MARKKLRNVICWRIGWAIGFRKKLPQSDRFMCVNDGCSWRKGYQTGKHQARMTTARDPKLDHYCEVGSDYSGPKDSEIAWRLGWFSAYSEAHSPEIQGRTQDGRRGGHGSDIGRRDAQWWHEKNCR